MAAMASAIAAARSVRRITRSRRPGGTPAAGTSAPVSVPQAAIVRRAELTALYVLDPAGKPVLRQVRLGPLQGEMVEVLSGLGVGDQVALEPQAAATASAPAALIWLLP